MQRVKSRLKETEKFSNFQTLISIAKNPVIRITDDSLQALSSSRYSNTPSNLKPLNKNKNLLKKANIKSKLQKAYASNQIIPSRNNDF